MMLQAIQAYYRQRRDVLPSFGFEQKVIPFVVVINRQGEYINIQDTRSKGENRPDATSFLVPKAVKKTSGIAANLLWDTAEYALGIDIKRKPEKTQAQFTAFIEKLLPYRADPSVHVVIDFLTGPDMERLQAHPHWAEICEKNPVVTFKIEGCEELICQGVQFLEVYKNNLESCVEENKYPCLVSGEMSAIAQLHPSIKSLYGAQSSGANIVSFNQPAFTSWNKVQGYNAPIGVKATFEYTTALNYLLSDYNPNRFRIGETSYVYWSDRMSGLVTLFRYLFIDEQKSGIETVAELYRVCQSSLNDPDGRFYFLGLFPNNARIAVCIWRDISLTQLATRIIQWIDDVRITGAEVFGLPCLMKLLKSTVLEYKEKYLSSRLSSDTLQSILDGGQLPCSLVSGVLCAIRRDKGKVNFLRAALIKGCLNRIYRFKGCKGMELKTALDEENFQTGYLLGRLFAIFERLQIEAHRSNLATTTASRYFSGASIRPQTVFGDLFKTHIHHLKKLRNPGRVINFQKMVGDLMQKLPAIPSYLNSEGQCLFAVGYYHQRQVFYTSVSEEEPECGEEYVTE